MVLNFNLDFYCKKALEDDYKYSESGLYYCPIDGSFDRYKEYIMKLPLNDKPELFGLHDNADISSAINETNNVCDLILNILPRVTSTTGKSLEEITKEKCI